MKLLCLLIHHADSVISREYIYQELWNNYGGADEGLTQAISFLRKALNNKDKKIIETIPKKGYILHGIPTKEENIKADKISKSDYLSMLLLAASCVAIVMSIISIQLIIKADKSSTVVGKSDATVVKNDSIKPSIPKLSLISEEPEFYKPYVIQKQNPANGIEKRMEEKSGLATVSSEKRRMVENQGTYQKKNSETQQP